MLDIILIAPNIGSVSPNYEFIISQVINMKIKLIWRRGFVLALNKTTRKNLRTLILKEKIRVSLIVLLNLGFRLCTSSLPTYENIFPIGGGIPLFLPNQYTKLIQ